MAGMLAVWFSIMCGGAAIGAKLHELAGIESFSWILASLTLQALAMTRGDDD